MKGGEPEKRAYPAIVVEMFFSVYQRPQREALVEPASH